MNSRSFSLVAAFLLTGGLAALALSADDQRTSTADPSRSSGASSDKPSMKDRPDVGELIRQLGSDVFEEREKAQRSLEGLGEDDLPALRAAAKKSSDAEVRRRLEEVVRVTEERATKDAYEFIEKVGGTVGTIKEGKPVKAGQAGTQELLGVSLCDTKFGDADVRRLKALGKVVCLDLAGTRVTDLGLRDLQSLPGLQSLYLSRTAVTDAGLAHLKPLKNLEALGLGETKVTGKGLNHLRSLEALSSLDLHGYNVGDDALVHIAALTRVALLSLDSTKVTDTGLARLPALPELSHLMLEQTGVTDAGLAYLARMKKLKVVHMSDTHITAEGVTGLRKAHPDLLIFEEVSGRYIKGQGRSQEPQR
jgi:hypothetical protein